MAVLFLTECRSRGKSVLQLLKMKPWSKESNSDGSIFSYIPASRTLLQRMVWTLKLQQQTTSYQFILLSFEKFIEYETCWSGIRSLQTTAAEVSEGVCCYCNSVVLHLLGFLFLGTRSEQQHGWAELEGAGAGVFLGGSSALFWYQMLPWNGAAMPRAMRMRFYSFQVGHMLLSCPLIETKIFILPDRYKKLFLCVCRWQ